MSNVCKTCNQTISWDMEVRKKLGIRGPINKDGSIHRCMGLHKEEEKPPARPPMQDVKPQLTDDEIQTLKQFVAMLKVIK